MRDCVRSVGAEAAAEVRDLCALSSQRWCSLSISSRSITSSHRPSGGQIEVGLRRREVDMLADATRDDVADKRAGHSVEVHRREKRRVGRRPRRLDLIAHHGRDAAEQVDRRCGPRRVRSLRRVMEAIIVAEKHPLETQAQVAGTLLLNLDQRTFYWTDESIAKNLDRIAGQSGSVALLFKARHEQRAVFVGDRAARGVGIADLVVRDAGFKHQRSGDSQGERGYDLTIRRQASVHDLIALDLQLSLDLSDLNSGAGRVAKSAGGDAVFGDLASANDAPALDPGGSHGIDAVLRDNGRAFA